MSRPDVGEVARNPRGGTGLAVLLLVVAALARCAAALKLDPGLEAARQLAEKLSRPLPRGQGGGA